MLTLKTEEKLINRLASLTELEFEGVLIEIRDHVFNNKLNHIIENVFQGDTIDELRQERDKLQEEFDDIESELDDLKSFSQKASEILESIDPDGDADEIKEKIDKANDYLT